VHICIPVTEDRGLQSPVNGHFGSAPLFVIVDTENGQYRTVNNHDSAHAHGMCKPLASLTAERVDVIIAGGIGMGALMKIQAANIRVFLSDLPNVEATLDAFKKGQLEEARPERACPGHEGHCH
jgi:predicted Fe-Mo cluster-binding NifX family protein